MEPKFQSSFIPKGSFTPNTKGVPMGVKVKERSLVEFLAFVVFIISIVLAVGVYGYKYYLKYRLNKMGTDLAAAQATLQPETIHELTRLDARINSTKKLISQHRAISPLLNFFQNSIPKTLRFSDFKYMKTNRGLELSLKGEARGYAALALASDLFNKSGNFTDATFSNLTLSDRGDVSFSFEAVVDPSLLSYNKVLETNNAVVTPVSAATSTQATSTRK